MALTGAGKLQAIPTETERPSIAWAASCKPQQKLMREPNEAGCPRGGCRCGAEECINTERRKEGIIATTMPALTRPKYQVVRAAT
mmetsp:Transcript_10267/g.17221  ORF Transcript_10267/g.17221 Transcript_10267/m.17221 type:complete len:85 (+) Transcript_10267:1321-1575(+)